MKADKYTVMNDLFVIEQYRDTEVESQRFLECKKYTQENEYVRMSWISAPDNKRAHSFFDKMGGIQENWINYSNL